MPKVTETKVGRVWLMEIEPRKWRCDWRDPLTRSRHRVVLPASNFKDAHRQADDINSEIAAGKGFGGRLRGSVGHTVKEAVLEAVKHTDANERTRADYLSRYNAFSAYLEANAKGVEAWAHVTEQVIANYVEHCRRAGISHDTLRLRLYVLRLTSAFMARTYPGVYRHVTVGLKLRRHDPAKAEMESEGAILNPQQVRGLLEGLKAINPMVHTWATVQALCGVRLLECAYLREQDIDAVNKTITIVDSLAHKPKNRHSYRVIPIAAEVLRSLGEWMGSLKVRHDQGFLFFPGRGSTRCASAKSTQARAGVFTIAVVSRIWDEALAQVRKQGQLDLPETFTPRRLRSTFVTAMRQAGADFAVLQRYIGHAPSTILSAHYDKVDMARLGVIAGFAQELFEGSGAFGAKRDDGAKKSVNGQ